MFQCINLSTSDTLVFVYSKYNNEERLQSSFWVAWLPNIGNAFLDMITSKDFYTGLYCDYI